MSNTVLEVFSSQRYITLKTAMEANHLRQKLIASNVSNIETAGYKTKDLNFDDVMDQRFSKTSMRLAQTHDRHMPGLQDNDSYSSAIFLAYNPENPNDGVNDVDIDREMVKNSETAMNYKILSNLLKRRYKGLKDLIDQSQ